MLQTALMRTRLEVRDARLCAIVFCRSSFVPRPKPGSFSISCADPLWGKRRDVDNSETADQNHGSGDGTVLYPTHRLTNDSSRTNRTPERYRVPVEGARVSRRAVD